MKKLAILLVIALGLTACGTTDPSFEPKSSVRLVTSMTYPEFPNIEPLPDVNFLPWVSTVPLDTSVVSVKNTTECRKVKTYVPEDKPYVVLPVEEQPPSWWSKCGENPVLPNSNVYIGFEQDQWNIILENFAKLKERNWQYKQRLEEVNRQRTEWRAKAEAERQRIAKETAPGETPEVKNTGTKVPDTKAPEIKPVNEEKPSLLKRIFN